MCAPLQEAMITLQNEVNARNERESVLQNTMDLQAIDIKYLKGELLAMT